jgi:hypothetical protein
VLPAPEISNAVADKYRLKCNREQPCQNCAARAEQAFCKYKGSKNESGFITSPHHEHKHADAMQQRIDRLETLVKTLIAQCQQKSLLEDSPLPNNGVQYRYNPRHETRFDVAAGMSDASTMPHNGGTTVVNEHHSVYKAANDWSDVIQEVRGCFSQLLCLRLIGLFGWCTSWVIRQRQIMLENVRQWTKQGLAQRAQDDLEPKSGRCGGLRCAAISLRDR